MSGNLFSDDAVRKLRQMFHEWSREDKRLPRYNHPSPRPMLPREDLVLYQASSTGTLPAVTASTTGITPGKITTAKQVSINSSGDAVAVNASRSLTIHNVGKGAGAASHVGWAAREYKTGRWVTAVPQAGSAEAFHRRSGGVTASTTASVWELSGFRALPGFTGAEITWASFSTSGSSDGTEVLTLEEAGQYVIDQCCLYVTDISSTGSTGWTQVFLRVYPDILTGGDTATGTGIVTRGAVTYHRIFPPDAEIPNYAGGDYQDSRSMQWCIGAQAGTRIRWYLSEVTGIPNIATAALKQVNSFAFTVHKVN